MHKPIWEGQNYAKMMKAIDNIMHKWSKKDTDEACINETSNMVYA
jgi:hypothetical protein